LIGLKSAYLVYKYIQAFISYYKLSGRVFTRLNFTFLLCIAMLALEMVFEVHKYYVMLCFYVLLFGSWMQIIHFNVLMHVPVISNERRTFCKCIPFVVLMTAAHIALLVVASIESTGVYCKADAVYPPHFLALFCLNTLEVTVFVIFYLKNGFINSEFETGQIKPEFEQAYRKSTKVFVISNGVQSACMLIVGICGQALVQNQDAVLCNETDNTWVWNTSAGNFFCTINILFVTGYCVSTSLIFYITPKRAGLFGPPPSKTQTDKPQDDSHIKL